MASHRIRGVEISNPSSKLELLEGPAKIKKGVRVDSVSRGGEHFVDLGDLDDNELLEYCFGQ